MKIHVRKLLEYTTDQLWEMLTGHFVVVFDDGEGMETNYKEVLYSSYGWDYFRKFPNVLIQSRHHVKSAMENHTVGAGTHLQLLGDCMWTVHDAYIDQGLVTRDELSEMLYILVNTMYCDLSYRLESEVAGMDIMDFIQIATHPTIRAVKAEAEPTEQGVQHINKTVLEVIKSDTGLVDNAISRALRSRLLSEGQVCQVLGVRGFVTDMDSNIFRTPVMRSFTDGLRSLYDNFIDSRSAAKALFFSKQPLQEAEYFSRRIQLVDQILRNLHHGDCGTTEYVYWKVRGKEVDPATGEVTHASDLPNLEGIYYRDEDDKLKRIREHDHHLIGRTLRLRSPVHCAHPDPYGICSTCFGELSLSVPDETNIGHMCATSMTQKSSQLVLSVKHVDGSAAVSTIVLADNEKKYFRTSSDGSSYLLAEGLKRYKDVWLVVPARDASNLTDVNAVGNVRDLNITRVSELRDVGIGYVDGDVEYETVLNVSLNRRLASMTYDLLEHVRHTGWTIDDSGNYRISMTGFDWAKPILTLPLKHFNMSDHSKAIAEMIESSVGNKASRDNIGSPDAFLVEFFDLVNSKLNVNLAILGVITYAAMIRSAEHYDYRLPKPGTDRGLGVMELTMDHRSLSANLAYEGHYDIFVQPMSYLLTHRPDHIMDVMVCPEEVIRHSNQAARH